MDTEIINARIVSTYSNGCTLKETAKACGASLSQVHKALAAAGVTIRQRGFAGMRPERRAEISRMGGAAIPSDRRAYSQSRDLARSAGGRGGMSKAHGVAVDGHGQSGGRLYRIWKGMLARCNNPADRAFPRYGGRGISVCDRWHSLENFMHDMGEPPCGWSIDRIDNDAAYSPENCRWATAAQQSVNKRNTRFVTALGRSRPVVEWAAEIGVARSTILRRLEAGWTPEEAVRSRAHAKPNSIAGGVRR